MNTDEVISVEGFAIKVIRTLRVKTARLQVEEGVISIAVPKALAPEKIHQVIKGKESWIREKLALQRQQQPATKRELLSGEAFPYLGRNYRLKVITGELKPVKLLHGRLQVTVPKTMHHDHVIRDMLTHWYQVQAEVRFKEKVKRLAKLVGVVPGNVSVRTFKSRWGSCNTKGDIQFHWKVIMAPHRIVDYVVVHELCHLLHHDHSPAFWKSVERMVPDYAECRAWLKEFGGGFDV